MQNFGIYYMGVEYGETVEKVAYVSGMDAADASMKFFNYYCERIEDLEILCVEPC